METKKIETEKASSNLCFTVPAGVELSDVFLRQAGDNSSEDSEGEEAAYDGKSFRLKDLNYISKCCLF